MNLPTIILNTSNGVLYVVHSHLVISLIIQHSTYALDIVNRYAQLQNQINNILNGKTLLT